MFSLTSWFDQWCNLKFCGSKRMDSSALSVANQLVFQSKLASLDPNLKEEIFPVWYVKFPIWKIWNIEIPNLEDLEGSKAWFNGWFG